MGFTYQPDNNQYCLLFDDSVTSSSAGASSTCNIKEGDAVFVPAIGNTITDVRRRSSRARASAFA